MQRTLTHLRAQSNGLQQSNSLLNLALRLLEFSPPLMGNHTSFSPLNPEIREYRVQSIQKIYTTYLSASVSNQHYRSGWTCGTLTVT
jgi:hypothetical protein